MVNWPQWLLYFQKSIRLDWNWTPTQSVRRYCRIYTFSNIYKFRTKAYNVRTRDVCGMIHEHRFGSFFVETILLCSKTLKHFVLYSGILLAKVQRILNKRKIWNFPLNKQHGLFIYVVLEVKIEDARWLLENFSDRIDFVVWIRYGKKKFCVEPI